MSIADNPKFRRFMRRLCWWLEDLADQLSKGNADDFYPSRRWEDFPTDGRHGIGRRLLVPREKLNK